MFQTLSDLREPDVPSLNPDRPGPEDGAETAHGTVTTLHYLSLQPPSPFRSPPPLNTRRIWPC